MTHPGGRSFEDFRVGDVYRSRAGRTISEADNTWFSLITNNSNQIHFNADYAARTEFGRPPVNSLLTMAIVTGLAVPDTSERGFALGWDEVTLPHPLFAGDTLYAETTVLEARASRSRQGWGIGSHSRRHPILSRLPEEEAVAEVVESKARLEAEMGRPVLTFAYPNGKAADFSAGIKAAIRKAGYRAALTTIFGVNQAHTDPFELRRIYFARRILGGLPVRVGAALRGFLAGGRP